MTKKQKNLIFGIIVLVFATLAYIFSNDSSGFINFGENQPTPEDVYQNEVSVKSASVSEDPSPSQTVSSAPDPEVSQTEITTNTYKVVKVVDGDTLDVDIDGKTERLRLIGIDTPETVDPRKPVQCFGKEASNRAKELLNGKSVSLEADESQGERDKYGRLLRYVFLADGTNFNLYMISEGYAHEYTYDTAYKYQKEFKQAEREARNAQKGLWSPDTCSGNS